MRKNRLFITTMITAFILLAQLVSLGQSAGNTKSQPELFISEYVEGTSNNKALELFNPTSEAIDLSQYVIKSSNNGAGFGSTSAGADARYELALDGTLEPGEVWVIASAQADQEILDIANFIAPHHSSGDDGSRVMSFNGNDAIGLYKDDELIDQVGFPDSDADIDVAGIIGGGKDHTIVRKPHIVRGNTNWPASSGTNEDDSEWIVYEVDSYEFLGWHEFEPGEDVDEPAGAGLFISEYIEGTSNNKAIELFNPTSEPIDLDIYVVKSSNNGAGWGRTSEGPDARYELALEGTLEPGEVWVIASAQADQEILDIANFIAPHHSSGEDGCRVMSFNGNDAIGLFKNNVLIDQVGFPDSDAVIDVAGIIGGGKDHTLVRKSHITKGNTNWAASAGTNEEDSEWIVYEVDSYEFLGWHEFGTNIRPVWVETVNAYPNPFSNTIWIENTENARQVVVYNIFGQEVINKHLNGDSRTSIQTQSLHPGIYMISVISARGERAVTKMIKR